MDEKVMKARQGEYPLEDKNMEREIRRFVAILGENTWKNKIAKLDAQLVSGKTKFYSEYLLSRNPLLVALKEYFKLIKQGKTIWKHKTNLLFNLFSIAHTTNKLMMGVSDAGKNVIRGNLRSDNIRPFLFELQIIIHFLRNDYDIEFNDLDKLNEDKKNFDFIVRKDDFVGEVECKSTDLDTGRKIKRSHFYQLADRLINRFESIHKSILFDISVNDNLKYNDVLINKIADNAIESYKSGKSNIDINENIHIKFVSIPNNMSQNQSYEMVQQHRNGKAHFAIQGKNGKTMIVKAESEKPDFFLPAIYKSLKIAEKQFTKKYPAMISCYIDDIQEHEWEA
ncbi:MAG: hypothetical protein IH825_00730, partial [Candidatus Marinimicrobia bacterium]|nr:hypothetical protein [Candidatus Neomarinimicrobiota bacterium]